MKHIITTFILLFASAAFGQKFEFDYHTDFPTILEQTKNSKHDYHYDKLLKRFQSNDTTMTDFEVLALLIGFTDNEHFKPYAYISTEREIYDLNGKGKFKESLAMSDSFLVHVPVSQQALIEKSYSHYKLDQLDSAQFYMTQFRRIMDAMGQSGDGLTPETGVFALGPADGQNFIKKYIVSDIGTMGSGRDKHGNFVDILEAVWEDEETGEPQKRNIYFQIQHATNTMFSDMNFDKPAKKNKKKKSKKE